MKPIRVLLVEDHYLVRSGIRALLEQLTGIQVVGEADDGNEGLRLMEELQPDVVLMDIAMQGMSGIEAAERAAHEFPQVHVLILSVHTSEQYVIRALSAGASGYLVKNARPAELELAIKAVAQGEMYISPAVSKPVFSHYVQSLKGASETPQQLLTPRQSEVLQLIAQGYTTKHIAEELQISAKTVEMHRMHLMKRLDVHDIAGVVRYAMRTGLITSEE